MFRNTVLNVGLFLCAVFYELKTGAGHRMISTQRVKSGEYESIMLLPRYVRQTGKIAVL